MPQRRNTAAVTVKEEELKGYLHNIADFRRGRIIRKGREVKNDIVYVEKGSDGFLSDRVRIRPTAVTAATTTTNNNNTNTTTTATATASAASYNNNSSNVGDNGSGVQPWAHLQKLGRRIWVAKEILMCSGQMNCERECGGMGRCRDDCLKKDEKRAKSGHRCSFRVNMRMYLHNIGNWEVDVTGRHVPPNINWVPPKKNLVNRVKTNTTRKNDRPSQCDTIASSKTIDHIGGFADRDKSYVDKKSSNCIGWTYPTNNNSNNNNYNNHAFPSLYGTASIIAVPNLNQLHQVEDQALDLTQNHRNLNFMPDNGSTKESLLSTGKFLSNKQFPVTVIPKVEQTELSNEGHSEKKTNEILSFVKDAVKLSKDNMEAFVIVSTAPNQFSFWGTSQFINKFKSSEPLVPYHPVKCRDFLEPDQSLLTTTPTTTTMKAMTTMGETVSNKMNQSHLIRSEHERKKEQQLSGKKQNCLKIPSPYSFKHSALFLTNLLHKRNATSAGAVVQVPGFNVSKNSNKHKTKAFKRKSSTQDMNIDDSQEKVTSKWNGDEFHDSRDVDSEEGDEEEAPKENVVITLMQKERSQALLRILKSRRNKAGKNFKFGANVQNGLTRDVNPSKIKNTSLVD
ncbi:uncharacterized protein LOC106884181 [Octopus bimaculoides]|uniref:uncharacterized protein LOC106884181 n=1 Tax=Octopus bimaculoides TaxID=37653 RepID=UPI0022DF258E|nr:uncharacterized protein LOC106884181 [Octopus bimaculoides]